MNDSELKEIEAYFLQTNRFVVEKEIVADVYAIRLIEEVKRLKTELEDLKKSRG